MFFMMGLISFKLKDAIRKGVNLGNKKDGIFCFDFRYEKIPQCCFSCGVFGHDESECITKKKAEEEGKAFISKELESWVKATVFGRKIAWLAEEKTKQVKSKGEDHKVRAVKRSDTDALIERLACTTMNDIECSVSWKKGGIFVLWRMEIDLRIQSYSRYHIDANIFNNDILDYRFTEIYGEATTTNRSHYWNVIKKPKETHGSPWIQIGDFNEVFHADEQQSKNCRPEGQLQLFREVVNFFQLVDVGYDGYK
ncbi:hypothetical protein G2W53_028856 [Senna tora]|uniref:Zinc knuckle CX2CX4HX4C domain-containing protein n=1 Tax=Senna tora TaxID=362788 RepID=A0A834T470_9FABA|nr:hypothetical protein G2W53_028856 [Senna tora]